MEIWNNIDHLSWEWLFINPNQFYRVTRVQPFSIFFWVGKKRKENVNEINICRFYIEMPCQMQFEVVYSVQAFFLEKYKRLKKKSHNGYHGVGMNRVPIERTLLRFVWPATIDDIDINFNELVVVLRFYQDFCLTLIFKN